MSTVVCPPTSNSPPPSSSTSSPYLPPDFTLITEVLWPPNLTLKNRTPQQCMCSESDEGSESCVDGSGCLNYSTSEECGSNCPAGASCGNRRITKKKWSDVQVFPTPGKGHGLMAMEHLNENSFVIEYVGEAVNEQDLNKRFALYNSNRQTVSSEVIGGEKMLYILKLDGSIYIDARFKGCVARYINHSCTPNCTMEKWKVKGIYRMVVFTTRAINKGEELTFDYKWERHRNREMTVCLCSTVNCRGFLEVSSEIKGSPSEYDDEENMNVNNNDVEVGSWRLPGPKDGKENLIAKRIKIFFPGNFEYFQASCSAYDPATNTHRCRYLIDDEIVEEKLDDAWGSDKVKWWMLDENLNVEKIKKKERRVESVSPVPGNVPIAAVNGNGNGNGWQRNGGNGAVDNTSNGGFQSGMEAGMEPETMFIKPSYYEDQTTKQALHSITLQNCVTLTPTKVPRTTLTLVDLRTISGLTADLTYFYKLTITGVNRKKAYNEIRSNIDHVHYIANNAQPTLHDVTVHHILIPKTVVPVYEGGYLPEVLNACKNVSVSDDRTHVNKSLFAVNAITGTLQNIERCKAELWNKAGWPADQPFPSEITNIKDNDVGGRYVAFRAGSMSGASVRLLEGQGNCGAYGEFRRLFNFCLGCNLYVDVDFDASKRANASANANGSASDAVESVDKDYLKHKFNVYLSCHPSNVTTIRAVLQERVTSLKSGAIFVTVAHNVLFSDTNTNTNTNTNNNANKNEAGGNASTGIEKCRLFKHILTTYGVDVTVDRRLTTQFKLSLKLTLAKSHQSSLSMKGKNENENVPSGTTALEFARKLILAQNALTNRKKPNQNVWTSGSNFSELVNKDTLASVSSSFSQTCVEISVLCNKLDLDPSAAAHAAIILMRYLAVTHYTNGGSKDGDNSSSSSSGGGSRERAVKMKDSAVCVAFIANKTQQVKKWRKLEHVLKVWYEVAFPGSTASFDAASVEAGHVEKRVLNDERAVLDALGMQVFWSGSDWIATRLEAVVPYAKVKKILRLAFSAPVLGAGMGLWLRHSVATICTACFAVLSGAALQTHEGSETLKTVITSLSAGSVAQVFEAVQVITQRLLGNPTLFKTHCDKDTVLAVTEFNVEQFYHQLHSLQLTNDYQSAITNRLSRLANSELARRYVSGISSEAYATSLLPNDVLAKLNKKTGCRLEFVLNNPYTDSCAVQITGNLREIHVAYEMLKEAVEGFSDERGDGKDDRMNNLQLSLVSQVTWVEKCEVLFSNHRLLDECGLARGDAGVIGFDELKMCAVNDERAVVKADVNIPSSVLKKHSLDWAVCAKFGFDGAECVLDVPAFSQLSNSSSSHNHSNGNNNNNMNNNMNGNNNSMNGSMNASKTNTHDQKTSQTSSLSYLLGSPTPQKRLSEITLHRWPPEKHAYPETLKLGPGPGPEPTTSSTSSSSSSSSMGMGFSACAYHEMQMLYSVHCQMPGVGGHPNFLEPLGIVKVDVDEGVRRGFYNGLAGAGTAGAGAGGEGGEEEEEDVESDDEDGNDFSLDDMDDDEEDEEEVNVVVKDKVRDKEKEKEKKDNDDKNKKSDKKPPTTSSSSKKRSHSSISTKKKPLSRGMPFKETCHLMVSHLPLTFSKIVKYYSKPTSSELSLLKQQRSSKSKTNAKTSTSKHSSTPINPLLLQSFFYDTLQAVNHLHSNSTLFRSLDPSSEIFLTGSGKIRLTALCAGAVMSEKEKTAFTKGEDLDGFSSLPKKSSPHSTHKKTQKDNKDKDRDRNGKVRLPNLRASVLNAAAPELLLGAQRHSKASDMWNLGCLFASLLLGKPLFGGKDRETVLLGIFKICGTPMKASKSGDAKRDKEFPVNFPNAKNFPFIKNVIYKGGLEKQYKHGVHKALASLMEKNGTPTKGYEGCMRLIDRMLRLDPSLRVTAGEALEDEYVVELTTYESAEVHAEGFAREWLQVRGVLLGEKAWVKVEEGKAKEVKREREGKKESMRGEEKGKVGPVMSAPSMLGFETAISDTTSTSSTATKSASASVKESEGKTEPIIPQNSDGNDGNPALQGDDLMLYDDLNEVDFENDENMS